MGSEGNRLRLLFTDVPEIAHSIQETIHRRSGDCPQDFSRQFTDGQETVHMVQQTIHMLSGDCWQAFRIALRTSDRYLSLP